MKRLESERDNRETEFFSEIFIAKSFLKCQENCYKLSKIEELDRSNVQRC